MGTAVRSCSRTSRLGAVAAVLLLTGCASDAPALPVDTTSVNRSHTETLANFSEADRNLSCDQIAGEQRTIRDKMAADNHEIEGNRVRNEVAGYFGATLLVPALATVNNTAQKNEITALYQRRDKLIKLAALKNCLGLP